MYGWPFLKEFKNIFVITKNSFLSKVSFGTLFGSKTFIAGLHLLKIQPFLWIFIVWYWFIIEDLAIHNVASWNEHHNIYPVSSPVMIDRHFFIFFYIVLFVCQFVAYPKSANLCHVDLAMYVPKVCHIFDMINVDFGLSIFNLQPLYDSYFFHRLQM